jgi:hypothetical protein
MSKTIDQLWKEDRERTAREIFERSDKGEVARAHFELDRRQTPVPTKAELLDHYATREPTRFLQFDAFANVGPDTIVRPDQDGDSLFRTETFELMTGLPAVRVLITPGTSKEKALQLLDKIKDWIGRDEL